MRAECEKLSLDTSGTKAALVARLEAQGGGAAAAQEEEEEEEEVVAAKPKRGAKAKTTTKAAAVPKKGKGKRKAADDDDAASEPAAAEPVLDVKAELAKKAKAAPAPSGPRKKDPGCALPGNVLEDYQCTLNQTNVGANNNK